MPLSAGQLFSWQIIALLLLVQRVDNPFGHNCIHAVLQKLAMHQAFLRFASCLDAIMACIWFPAVWAWSNAAFP